MDRDSDLSEALLHASRSLLRRWRAALEGCEVFPHQARALRTVCAQEHARLREVAGRLRIAPRSVTEVVDSLEERGLVVRRPDPADRRAVLVVATDEGRQLHAVTDRLRHDAAADFFGRLEPVEREEFARLLRRLVD